MIVDYFSDRYKHNDQHCPNMTGAMIINLLSTAKSNYSQREDTKILEKCSMNAIFFGNKAETNGSSKKDFSDPFSKEEGNLQNEEFNRTWRNKRNGKNDGNMEWSN